MALTLGVFLGVFSVAGQAKATLGESVDSIESDRNALSAVRHDVSAGRAYIIHEVSADSATVREYVSSSGTVFGIAWRGLMHPDLAILLGSYFGEYNEALKHTPRPSGQRRIQVRAPRVVVEKWGHMRNLHGRAYVSDLVPEGVSIDEIR